MSNTNKKQPGEETPKKELSELEKAQQVILAAEEKKIEECQAIFDDAVGKLKTLGYGLTTQGAFHAGNFTSNIILIKL